MAVVLQFDASKVKPREVPADPPQRTERQWSIEQQAIFKWFAEGRGHLVVRARAGTGKTTTILEALNYARETRIILCAFNKRIAAELSDKLRRPDAEARTLHSIGFRFITQHWKVVIDNKRGFKLADRVCGRDTPREITSMVTKLAGLAKEMVPYAKHTSDIRDIQWSFDCVPGEEWAGSKYDEDYIAVKALEAMELALENTGTVDFSDMLFVPLRKDFVVPRWDLVVVDEAQDMNAAQLMLAQRICRKGGRIAVVGDDRQAIYGFRGADKGSLDRLKEAYSASELGLTTTYRCPQSVVRIASAIVPDYRAAPTAPRGTIQRMNVNRLAEVANPGDFVLSRKNAPLVKLCLAILKRGTRARIEGRDIGKGIVAVIRKQEATTLPVLMERLALWEEKLCLQMIEADREDKVEEVHDTAETIRELSLGLSSVDELVTRVDNLFNDVGAGQVICSSVHRAKGLEADRVFLVECSFRQPSDPSYDVEEQNIRYVAVTRSKGTLVLAEGEV